MPKAARSSRRNGVVFQDKPDSATRESDANAPSALRFPFSRNERLPDKAAFSQVFANARRSRDRSFTVLFRKSQRANARLGMAIAKKNCRLAVARNRLKRIIRESFREHQATLGGLDIVVMNNKGAESMSNLELFRSLAAHWQRCQQAVQRGQEQN
ncbi:MAG: ribonuclease P protein component [Woeseia sp.]